MNTLSNPIESIIKFKNGLKLSKGIDNEEIEKAITLVKSFGKSTEETGINTDGLSDSLKEYINNAVDAGKSTEEITEDLQDAGKASKVSAAAMSILESVVTALVVAFVIKTIDAFVNYEQRLAEQTRQATDNLKAQQQTIDTYSTRIQALYDKINSGQLTLDEHIEANRELREIQQELVDHFDEEANGINLVTTSLEKQSDVLEKVNNLKASQYLQTEWENAINKDTDSDKWFNALWTGANVIGLLNPLSTFFASSNVNEGIATDYRKAFGLDSHLDEMNKEYEQFSGKIEATSDDMFNHIIEGYNNVRKTTSGDFEIFGNVEEAKDTILHLQNDYKQFPGYTDAWANSLGNVWNKADDIVQKYGEAYHAQIEMNIASNEQYVAWQEQLQEIYKKYEEANISGNTNTADEYTRQYKDLIRQIRSQVQSSTYQNAIISVVPEIADVDYDNFESQINGVLNSPEVQQFKNLNLPINISADTAKLYSQFKEIYDIYQDIFKNDYQIKSFEEFIEVMNRLDKNGTSNNLALNILDRLHDDGYSVGTSEALRINQSGGSFSGRYQANGQHFITDAEIEKLHQYKDEIIELGKSGIDVTDDITIAFSNLTSKYGEDFTNLLTMILSKEGQLDWSEWLNEDEFKAVLASLVISSGLTEEQIKQILIGQGLIESDTRREVTGQVENFLKQSFGDVELSDKDLYWMNNLINGIMNSWSEEDLNQLPFIWEYVQVPEGTVPSINDLFNALIRYKKALEEVNQEENPFSTISDSVKDYSTDIKPWIDDLGSAYDAIFNGENGFDIEVVDDDLLNNIRSQFESIQQAFAENGIADAFDTQALEDFLAVLSDDATKAEEAQAAFNAYATSLFYSADGLKNLNEETANSIKQMLQKSGVENYEDVVNAMLDYQEALEYIEEKEIDLTKVTADEIQMLITKGEVSEAVAGKITLLAMQEQLVNINQMNFESSINALYALAKQCGIAEEYVLALEKAMANIKAVDQQYAHQTGAAADAAREGAERAAWEARKRLEEQVSLNLEDLDLKIKVPKVESGGGGKDAGKEEADEYLEAFNAELENLDWLREQGFIDEKEYLDQLRILYQRYFEGNDKYTKEFFENQRKYLEGLKDLYENALSAITGLLDDEIDKIDELEEKEKKEFEEQKKANDKKIKSIEKVNKGLDKQIKALEKEQKAIQKQNIDPIDEQIKGREVAKKVLEEELSIMQKANDERQDAIELQKLQYEMERAAHQKNLLVNTLCQPIQ